MIQDYFKTININQKRLKMLKALIWVLNIYPIHARTCLIELSQRINSFCFPTFIVDELFGKSEILDPIIIMIDYQGREKTATYINNILPEYAANIRIDEPVRTIWLKPHPYLGPRDEFFFLLHRRRNTLCISM
jgi:hypothetical protein